MPDSHLAEIYGYEPKQFNRQVQRNIKKYDEDFRFQLTKEEYENLKCQNGTSSWGGDRHLPYAFTEQGIYMLMTVLHGELATKQSKALIRIFHAMKNYILESNNYSLASKVAENEQNIKLIQAELSETLKKSDISPILLNFNTKMQNEFVFLNGELAKATETYIDIYASAEKCIYIIDDYINIKTLRHLRDVKPNVEIIIFSDNKARCLRKSDYDDFRKEYPKLKPQFIRTNSMMHDRFIMIDSKTYYHCGASLKDTGNKLSMINLITSDIAKSSLEKIVGRMKENERLRLY